MTERREAAPPVDRLAEALAALPEVLRPELSTWIERARRGAVEDIATHVAHDAKRAWADFEDAIAKFERRLANER